MDERAQIINYCIEEILRTHNKPALVAVAGESGSGKSHFTKLLQKELSNREMDFAFINHDDFLIPRAERESLRKHVYREGEFKGKSYWDVLENWYYLDDFHSVLKKLRAGESASYYPYIHDDGKISNQAKIIEPKDIILLENKLFLDEMDIIIELRVDRKKIIERKIDRDSDVRTPQQTIEMHERAQGYYWDRMKPQDAHIIIDNNDFEHPELINE